MNSTRLRVISVVIWVIAIATTVILARFYFDFVSNHVNEDSSDHLSEVYSQVDNNFNSFLEQNWKNLEQWDGLVTDVDPEVARQNISLRKNLWGFSDFLFLSNHDEYITIDGIRGELTHDDEHVKLMEKNEPVMDGQQLPDGTHFTLLAIPVAGGTFEGFDYKAIAVTFTNEDIARSLDTDAFGGLSTCFVVRGDGSVVLSTQEGGTVFGNYLSYLKAASNLDASQLAQLQEDWEDEVGDVIRCKIGEESFYISYEPIEYEDYILVGVVPESAVSGNLLEIQEATIDVAAKIALLLGAAVALQIILRYRKKTRQSAIDLKNRDRMFSMLSANVDDISLMLNGKNWSVEYVSPNIERLLGVPAADVQRDINVMNVCNLDGAPALPAELMTSIKNGESLIREQEHINAATGERHWYHEVIYREKDGDNDTYFIVMSDRTEERRMNESLEEALNAAKNANRAKSDFLSNMSHDIRTPMNAILGFTELMDINSDDSEKVHEYVGKISASGQHLLGLINDVLDMSKIESGKTTLSTEEFELSQLVESIKDIIGPQAKAKSQTFDVNCNWKSSGHLIGDKLRVSQILLNLLSNAVKYTPDGGHVTFDIDQVPNSSTKYEKIRFSVVDDGYGMTPEFLETIFDPFTREERSTINAIQGTGLGMAITKNLVDLMGGIISVESTLGEGSKFTVELSFGVVDEKASADAAAAAAEEIAVCEDALQGLLILMAEDNEMSAEMLTERLDIEGASVERARNGQEAVDMFAASEPGHFDLILMDVEMPVMGGHDATRAIRSADHADAASIPIFAMTANVFAEDVKKALDAGMNAHLAKPVDIDKVKLNVSKFVNNK